MSNELPNPELIDWFLQVLSKSASDEEPKTWSEMMCQVASDLLSDFEGEVPGAGNYYEVNKKDDHRPR